VHEANLCPLYKCTRCRVKRTTGTAGAGKVRQVQRMLDLMAEGTKAGSWAVQRRGLANFVQYLEGQGGRLPAQEDDVALWLTDCVKRQDRLDSSTAETYMAGVAAWHLQAGLATEGMVKNPTRGQTVRSVLKVVRKHYKLSSKAQRPLTLSEWLGLWERGFTSGEESRQVRHARLAMMLATFGPFRQVASKALKVVYRVAGGQVTYGVQSNIRVVRDDGDWRQPYILITSVVDKNVDSSKIRKVPIPAKVLGVRAVELLESYLLEVRPPSGGFLLAVPLGDKERWSTARFSGMSRLVKGAFARAFPGKQALGVGGSSLRKSWAQWMKRVRCTGFEVVDVCGWSRESLLRSLGTQVVYQYTELDSQMVIKQRMHRRLDRVQSAMA
jgi:hypothetical protein